MLELKSGMVAYAKTLSLHVDNTELKYNAPRGTKFAVILMVAEKPDSTTGIKANDFLSDCGWELKGGDNA